MAHLLFVLYVIDLSTVSDASLSFVFADDATILYTGKNLNTLNDDINTELIIIDEWLTCKKLSIIIKKTHYIIYSGKKKVTDDHQLKNQLGTNWKSLFYKVLAWPIGFEFE